MAQTPPNNQNQSNTSNNTGNNPNSNSGGFINPLAQPARQNPQPQPQPQPQPHPQPVPPPPPPPPPVAPPPAKPVSLPPIKPPPPPLATNVEAKSKPLQTGQILSQDSARASGVFSLPTDDEIMAEKRREKLMKKPSLPEPESKPAPLPKPVPPPAPRPTSLPPPPPLSPRPTPPPPPPPSPMQNLQPAPRPVPKPAPVLTQPNRPQPPLPPKGDIPLVETEPRPPWFIPVISVSALVVVGIILLFLQSSGVIYAKFLASMVGGIPRNPEAALNVVRDATLNGGTYEYTAIATIGFENKIPDIEADELPTSPSEASINFSGQADIDKVYAEFETNINSQYIPTLSYLEGVYAKDGQNITTFLDLFLSVNNSWRKMSQTEFKSYVVAAPFVGLQSINLIESATGSAGELIGQSELPEKGVKTVVYKYPLENFIEPTDASIKDSQLAFWVNKRSGLIEVYQLDTLIETDVGTILLSLQVTPEKYGEVEVETASGSSGAVSGTLSDYYSDFGYGLPVDPTEPEPIGPTEPEPIEPTLPTDSAATRDKQRTTDLNKIKTVLEEYKESKGTYPISKAVDRTNASTVLKGAIVPSYLSSLPVDPLEDKYWYGYTSDGYSFTLTSILEDTDSSGLQGDNVKYQEITNK